MQELKDFIGEFQRGYIYCLAGRPGMGKTTLLKEIIKLEYNKKITVFYLDREKEWFMKGLKNQKNIVVYDGVSAMEEIEKVLRDSKPDIAAIDSFQLLNDNGSNFDEIYTIASDKLMKLSKELNIPIIIVSQLGRECEKRIDERPKLSDFCYTSYSNLLKVSDCIMFLYNEHYYDWGKEHKREIIVEKNRGGGTGTIIEKRKQIQKYQVYNTQDECSDVVSDEYRIV